MSHRSKSLTFNLNNGDKSIPILHVIYERYLKWDNRIKISITCLSIIIGEVNDPWKRQTKRSSK